MDFQRKDKHLLFGVCSINCEHTPVIQLKISLFLVVPSKERTLTFIIIIIIENNSNNNNIKTLKRRWKKNTLKKDVLVSNFLGFPPQSSLFLSISGESTPRRYCSDRRTILKLLGFFYISNLFLGISAFQHHKLSTFLYNKCKPLIVEKLFFLYEQMWLFDREFRFSHVNKKTINIEIYI